MRHILLALCLLASCSVLAACAPARDEANWAVTDIDQETEFYEPRDEATGRYDVRPAGGVMPPRGAEAPAARPAAPSPRAAPLPTPAPYAVPPSTGPSPRPPYGTPGAPPPPPPPPNWPGDR